MVGPVDRCRTPSGSFGAPGPLEAVHTIYVVLVLQASRRLDLSPYLAAEKAAIEWLLAHPDEATKLVEERMTIDPGSGRFNYGLLFMTDSLLIRALAGSAHAEHRNSELARAAMISLRDRMDPEGGFYGSRVFSWSTAKALSALSAALSQFQEFPRRRPEYTGARIGHFVLGFAALLSLVVVYLTVNQGFHLLQAVILMFLMLSSLVAYGAIGERTFKELVKADLRLLRKK
jgi:hypothetical protein